MNVEICDVCEKNESNKRFKVKLSRKGCYQRIGSVIAWTDIWQPYEKISICEDCAEKLLGIKSRKTMFNELVKGMKKE